MQEFYNISTCPVTLAVGEHDKIVTIEQYRSLDKNAVQIPNVAHNAHVENPEAMWALVEKLEGMTSKD
jgi:pimeloyl-ACP methyl ester carboxylesterase